MFKKINIFAILIVLGFVISMELSPFGGHFFHGVERVSTCESGLQFIAI
ncbi:hypothetical protein C8R28_104818 [Nitrosomonas ureae]|uniref:Uncharacterized protein n=1 Tax=Nitrosomonas ureae TaxID=44577 RepID=A0A2T5I6W1_9PROT|nr:hypothetical protein C8R28_104818 [Nitrosomonas ureae]